jgi:hypothetical protein
VRFRVKKEENGQSATMRKRAIPSTEQNNDGKRGNKDEKKKQTEENKSKTGESAASSSPSANTNANANANANKTSTIEEVQLVRHWIEFQISWGKEVKKYAVKLASDIDRTGQ